MKTFLKVAGIVLLVVVALAAIGVTFLLLKKPAQRPATTEKFEATPQRLARGRYLVHHVSDCVGCHSDHLLTYAIPIKPGTLGMGGLEFNEGMGFPGVLRAQNITSDPATGLGNWTDGEILRAMREGVDRDGNALFPMMPYQHLRQMSDEDAKSIVVYLRTLAPIKNEVPKSQLKFPLNVIVKFIPQPLDGPVSAPDPKDRLAYGKYLTTIGGCYECHTPHDEKNQIVAAKAFAGGWEMKGVWGRNYTANLTPHPSTFVGRATREEWIARFRAFATMNASNAPAVPKGGNTVMPWLAYSGMTDEDLGAIYDYLRTVPPVKNDVRTFPDR
ncbi:MAG TPA: cytochrome C [Thermoanaerobaculia bacterium]|jgi:mono/diheme cytochrome c family protein